MELEERFWKKVDKSAGPDECWPWMAARLPRGYGITSINRKNRLSHRVAYALTHGDVPTGFFVCHSCDNPPCCNPSHLWVGTQMDNMKDMSRKSRGGANRGHAGNTRLTEDQVRAIRNEWTPQPKGPGLKVGSTRELAMRFGVSRATIQQLLEGKSWKWVK